MTAKCIQFLLAKLGIGPDIGQILFLNPYNSPAKNVLGLKVREEVQRGKGMGRTGQSQAP